MQSSSINLSTFHIGWWILSRGSLMTQLQERSIWRLGIRVSKDSESWFRFQIARTIKLECFRPNIEWAKTSNTLICSTEPSLQSKERLLACSSISIAPRMRFYGSRKPYNHMYALILLKGSKFDEV